MEEKICADCGYSEEAHIDRTRHFNCYPDRNGKYHWNPCKKFKLKEAKE